MLDRSTTYHIREKIEFWSNFCFVIYVKVCKHILHHSSSSLKKQSSFPLPLPSNHTQTRKDKKTAFDYIFSSPRKLSCYPKLSFLEQTSPTPPHQGYRDVLWVGFSLSLTNQPSSAYCSLPTCHKLQETVDQSRERERRTDGAWSRNFHNSCRVYLQPSRFRTVVSRVSSILVVHDCLDVDVRVVFPSQVPTASRRATTRSSRIMFPRYYTDNSSLCGGCIMLAFDFDQAK